MKIKNQIYNEHGTIDLEIQLEEGGEWHPFTASEVDNAPHAIAIYEAVRLMDIAPFIPPEVVPLTPQELRAAMPDKTLREFRDILIDEDILTDASPDEVTVAIQQIPFDKERTKALNAWHNMTTASRSDPYIDMIGAMFGLSPEDIDVLWDAEP